MDEAGRARLRELAEHMAASRGLFASRDVAEILRAIDALDRAEAERDAARAEAARLREAITKIADDVLWTREHVDPDDRETCAALPDLLLVIESDLRATLAAADMASVVTEPRS